MSRRTIWGNIFFTREKFPPNHLRKYIFYLRKVSEPELRTAGLSGKLFRMVVKMHSTSPEDEFAESVRLQIYNCLFFRHFEQRSFRRFSVFFSKGKKTAFHVFKRTFWAKISYWQKSLQLTFLDFKWKTLNFMGNSISFCRVIVNTIKHLSGKTISPQLFLWSSIF